MTDKLCAAHVAAWRQLGLPFISLKLTHENNKGGIRRNISKTNYVLIDTSFPTLQAGQAGMICT